MADAAAVIPNGCENAPLNPVRAHHPAATPAAEDRARSGAPPSVLDSPSGGETVVGQRRLHADFMGEVQDQTVSSGRVHQPARDCCSYQVGVAIAVHTGGLSK